MIKAEHAQTKSGTGCYRIPSDITIGRNYAAWGYNQPIYTVCHLHYIQPASLHSMSFTLYTTSQYTQYVIYTIYNQPIYTVCHLHYIQPD